MSSKIVVVVAILAVFNQTNHTAWGNTVGFSARLHREDSHGGVQDGRHYLQINANMDIHYDIVLANTGGAYNKRTGVFTVPQDGLYEFSLSMTTLMDAYICCHGSIYLSINGAKAGWLGTTKGANYKKEWDHTSLTQVFKLRRGAQVKAVSGPYKMQLEEFSNFSGFLIE